MGGDNEGRGSMRTITETGLRRVGNLAWAGAWAGLVAGQLHALARYRTADGREDLETASTRVWAEPAGDLLSPLLTWASPDVVYLTYGKVWLPVFLAFTVCAFVVRGRREPYGAERWAWRFALPAYVGACVAVGSEYWTMWTGMNDTLLDAMFLASLPVMLLTLISSTWLGIVLMRRGERLPGLLLALAVPGFVVIPMVTSLGSVVLPIAFGFGVLGRRMARHPDRAARASEPRFVRSRSA
jgi:hypothetical protein